MAASEAAKDAVYIDKFSRELGITEPGADPIDLMVDNKAAIELVRAQLETWLVELKALPKEELMEQRYQKFRGMGVPTEL